MSSPLALPEQGALVKEKLMWTNPETEESIFCQSLNLVLTRDTRPLIMKKEGGDPGQEVTKYYIFVLIQAEACLVFVFSTIR